VSARARPFCSDAARSRGDDPTATTARIDVWILVELTRPWGRNPLDDAILPDAVRQALRRAGKSIPHSRIVFIKRRIGGPERCRIFVARSAPTVSMATLDLESLDDVANVDFEALSVDGGTLPLPLVLVCTHGQHDSCCGRRGYPLYDALRQRSDIEAWQCSHIGGDRFAANALVLPAGLLYGPVECSEAGALADSAVRDEIFLSAYRGCSAMTRPEQAAETFVRGATQLLAREAVRPVGRERIDDGQIVVHLRAADGAMHDVTLERYVATPAAFLTCSSTHEDVIEQYRVVGHRVR
jgi:hypothetical protein